MRGFETSVNSQIHLMAGFDFKIQSFIGLENHQKLVDFDRKDSDLLVAMAD